MASIKPSTLGLRHVRLLEGLPEARLASLAAQCHWRTVERGEAILARNSRDRDVHFVVSGRVRVTTFSANGRQVTFQDQQAGELFGDLAAIDGLPRSADVVALESVLLASLPPDDFRALIAAEPLVQERVLQRLAGLVRSLSERVIELSTLGVTNRIHVELLRLAHEAGVSGRQARIEPAPKHADIASQVSTYREQVTREISAMARLGLVARQDGALLLLDVQRLEQLVEEVRASTQKAG